MPSKGDEGCNKDFEPLNRGAAPGDKATDSHRYIGNDRLAKPIPTVEQKGRAGLKQVMIVSDDDCKKSGEEARKPKAESRPLKRSE